MTKTKKLSIPEDIGYVNPTFRDNGKTMGRVNILEWAVLRAPQIMPGWLMPV